MSRIPPKTLAKVLATIACFEPGEHGLFWDPDGSMPWKEFLWALQQQDGLKHVREAHVREISLLGIDLPFRLEGPVLRLSGTEPGPVYAEADSPPPRLYFGAKRRSYETIRMHGLSALGRPYLRLAADRSLALLWAQRRDPDPFVLEIDTAKAAELGMHFLSAGGGLYLASILPASCLILPLIRQEEPSGSAASAHGAKKGPPSKTGPSLGAGIQAGGFTVGAHHLGHGGQEPESGAKREGKKGRGGAGWKRASRGERNKRSV